MKLAGIASTGAETLKQPYLVDVFSRKQHVRSERQKKLDSSGTTYTGVSFPRQFTSGIQPGLCPNVYRLALCGAYQSAQGNWWAWLVLLIVILYFSAKESQQVLATG
jgi:hypothetical protein